MKSGPTCKESRARVASECRQVSPKGWVLTLSCKHSLSRALQSMECQGLMEKRGPPSACLAGIRHTVSYSHG